MRTTVAPVFLPFSSGLLSVMIASRILAAAVLAASVSAHATWQQLWINGVDYGSACVRKANSNSPIAVDSTDMNCNAAAASAANTCAVKAGDTLQVEMHQQPGDRTCSTEAIGGQHYGPVMVYLGKVSNASTATPSSVGWFKIAEHGLMSNNPDYFANQVLNNNCGHYTFKLPSDIANGDYLLRAETIALHTASSSGGAQFYAGCYQITVSGGGSASPATVKFPGAYSASDPGVLINIHTDLTTYVIPGPTPYGTTVPTVATTAWPTTATINTANLPTTDFTTLPGGAATSTTTATSTSGGTSTTATTTTSAPAATQTKYGQCGGTGWTGPTACVSGSTCTKLNDYYSQCT
ncbi:glycosyl hydrolase family 61-domain-containing protein [Auriculariales sp. MPI-PUGE-AT-0066]|nr:glycosyl hydrolase family 61-domain-containing protein [Auriculariales sp. MPI-PUGE-AT-0066]